MRLLLIKNKSKWISKWLDQQKQILAKCQGELSLNSLSEMNLLHAVMKETLRLYPLLVLLMSYHVWLNLNVK